MQHPYISNRLLSSLVGSSSVSCWVLDHGTVWNYFRKSMTLKGVDEKICTGYPTRWWQSHLDEDLNQIPILTICCASPPTVHHPLPMVSFNRWILEILTSPILSGFDYTSNLASYGNWSTRYGGNRLYELMRSNWSCCLCCQSST